MHHTTCPFSSGTDGACPVLHPGGSCVAPDEVAELVRREVAVAAAHHGVDPRTIGVELRPGRTDGALRVVVRPEAIERRFAHELAVRALQGLCEGARSARTTSVSVPTGPSTAP